MRLFEGTQFDVPPRCERCEELEADCKCPPPAPERIPPHEQTAVVSLEKRKRGKSVTLVSGLCPVGTDLAELLTQLKNSCGAGGTVKQDVLEIQGNQAEPIVSKLREIGFAVKQR